MKHIDATRNDVARAVEGYLTHLCSAAGNNGSVSLTMAVSFGDKGLLTPSYMVHTRLGGNSDQWSFEAAELSGALDRYNAEASRVATL